MLRGAFTDFYSGPVYSGRFSCSENAFDLNGCQLVPENDSSCALDPSRAVGFRCVRGMTVENCLYASSYCTNNRDEYVCILLINLFMVITS